MSAVSSLPFLFMEKHMKYTNYRTWSSYEQALGDMGYEAFYRSNLWVLKDKKKKFKNTGM